jgi:GMP synthase (glutamine-hydrolysing)
MEGFVESWVPRIRERVGNRRVVCGLSGGVDSTVVAALIHEAIGDRLTCIFVDNGLLRKDEAHQVVALFREKMALDVRAVDAGAKFLKNLAGVEDPEKKRRIIGVTFIEVFEAEAKKLQGADFLAQGTLYPDVIESISVRGPSATIKSTQRRRAPERMKLELLSRSAGSSGRVRALGRVLGVPEEIVGASVPRSGLAIRVIGPSTTSTCVSSATPMRSCRRRSAAPTSTTRSGRRSRSCCR